jgi:hypothetical protein
VEPEAEQAITAGLRAAAAATATGLCSSKSRGASDLRTRYEAHLLAAAEAAASGPAGAGQGLLLR